MRGRGDPLILRGRVIMGICFIKLLLLTNGSNGQQHQRRSNVASIWQHTVRPMLHGDSCSACYHGSRTGFQLHALILFCTMTFGLF